MLLHVLHGLQLLGVPIVARYAWLCHLPVRHHQVVQHILVVLPRRQSHALNVEHVQLLASQVDPPSVVLPGNQPRHFHEHARSDSRHAVQSKLD